MCLQVRTFAAVGIGLAVGDSVFGVDFDQVAKALEVTVVAAGALGAVDGNPFASVGELLGVRRWTMTSSW
jgi:hypothetical protein